MIIMMIERASRDRLAHADLLRPLLHRDHDVRDPTTPAASAHPDQEHEERDDQNSIWKRWNCSTLLDAHRLVIRQRDLCRSAAGRRRCR
jgi:hypothetical protein